MRNGSVFRLQVSVWLNGDGSLLCLSFFLCWWCVLHQMIWALNMICIWLDQYSKEMGSRLNFSSITRAVWVFRARKSACACTAEEHVRTNKQGRHVCLQYAFERRSSAKNVFLRRGFLDHLKPRNLFPITDDRLDDCVHLVPLVSKLYSGMENHRHLSRLIHKLGGMCFHFLWLYILVGEEAPAAADCTPTIGDVKDSGLRCGVEIKKLLFHQMVPVLCCMLQNVSETGAAFRWWTLPNVRMLFITH